MVFLKSHFKSTWKDPILKILRNVEESVVVKYSNKNIYTISHYITKNLYWDLQIWKEDLNWNMYYNVCALEISLENPIWPWSFHGVMAT